MAGRSITIGGNAAGGSGPQIFKFELCYMASPTTLLQIEIPVQQSDSNLVVATKLMTEWNSRSKQVAFMTTPGTVTFNVQTISGMRVTTDVQFTLNYNAPPSAILPGLTAQWSDP